MKFKIILILMVLSCARHVSAELDLINNWRIEQATERCEAQNNDLIYKEYWGDTVKPENLNSVCLAEYFAHQVAEDGEEWLNTKAVELIEQCRLQGKNKKSLFFSCLEEELDLTTKSLASPCKELAAEGLWEYDRCKNLVTYIFIRQFNEVLESTDPPLKKLMKKIGQLEKITWLRIIGHPISAIILFFLYVLDFVFLIEPGNWMKISKKGAIVGGFIVLSCFTAGGLRYLSSGIAIFLTLCFLLWGHKDQIFKPEAKSRW